MEERLLQWIREQQDVLDRVIADAASDFKTTYNYEAFSFDAARASAEMWNLNHGKDLCYDRPAIGFVYSLWYHGKRVNTFLRYYLHLIIQSLGEEKIELFDLGAGTGAVQWAVGIVYAALKANSIKAPIFSVVNIDSSPFMLQYNEHFLWKHFIQRYPICNEIGAIYRVNSWTNEGIPTKSNIWLTASYLFDHSENAKETASDFERLAAVFEPSRLLLLSAARKSTFVDAVVDTLCKSAYEKVHVVAASAGQMFTGPLRHVGHYRQCLQQEADYGFWGEPSWSMEGLYGVVLVKKQGIFFARQQGKIDLYRMPEHNRAKIFLTTEQRKAAANGESHSIIVGPAGCGKSVVLTQRVKNIVEDPVYPYNPQLKMLVTTFNKDLTRQLGEWVEQLLDPARCARQQWIRGNGAEPFSWFKFQGSKAPNIYVYHMDILPTKVGGLRSCDVTMNGHDVEAFHLQLLDKAAKEYSIKNKIDYKKYAKILDPVFLLEEYHRIIYGWQCTRESVYQEKERVGRGNNPTLQYKSVRRRIIWDIICDYLSRLNKDGLGNFTMQRHRLLRKLSESNNQGKFDYILVDEIQDCTFADYDIFHRLLKPGGKLILAGDLAQSIHLGTAVHFPTSGFAKIKLSGSFRLPFLISAAVMPLSQAINSEFKKRKASGDTEIISPYKGSPPGARPIIVYGKDCSSVALKIRDIFIRYRIFGFDQIAVFERDCQLASELALQGISCSAEIILRSKGLEKPCVLWSTRVGVDTKKDILEFVYTILTRTTSVLIIAIYETTNAKFVEALRYLSQDLERVILWDTETVLEIQKLHQGVFPTQDDEDIDDSGEVDPNTVSPSVIEE